MLKRKQEVVTLSVQLQLIPTPHACAVLAQELVKHYLYMRNQLPGLFDTLQSQMEVTWRSLLQTPVQVPVAV